MKEPMKHSTSEKVTVRDGRQRKDQIGREHGQIHDFLCNLRRAGATPQDLSNLQEVANRGFCELLIAGMRELVDMSLPAGIINLDRDPFPADETTKAIVDSRLGMYRPVITPPSILRLGDRQLKFLKPEKGFTVVTDDMFQIDLGTLRNKNLVDLNKLGAVRLCEDSSLVGMTVSMLRELPGNAIVFCLGTIWVDVYQRQAGAQCPPFATSIYLHKGMATTVARPVPVGKWPDDCFIAVLV